MHVQKEDMLKTVHLTFKALLHIEEENHDSWGFLRTQHLHMQEEDSYYVL